MGLSEPPEEILTVLEGYGGHRIRQCQPQVVSRFLDREAAFYRKSLAAIRQ